MKFLKFKKMHLISTVEQRARTVEFDPATTLISGPNQTGKSSLLKSIYWTFGAEPAAVHPTWKNAQVSALVRFELDGAVYSILRQRDSFSIFDSENKVIRRLEKVTKGVGPFLAELFDFKLTLPSQQDNLPAIPPPAFQFLPYYIDQDFGWKENWRSFDRLSQFRNWRKDVAEYHVGIRPNEYYTLKSQRAFVQAELESRSAELKVIEQISARLSESFKSAQFDLDPKAFEQEIGRLVEACNQLLIRENDYKVRCADLETERTEIEEQIKFTQRAAAQLRADYEFASHIDAKNVPCPVCGTEYENSFAERFAIASDQEDLTILISELAARAHSIRSELEELTASFLTNQSDLAKIRSVLQSRREAVTFEEVLRSSGKVEAQNVLKDRLNETMQLVTEASRKLDGVNAQIRSLTDKTRTQAILEKYRTRMAGYLQKLDVPTLPGQAYSAIDAKIREVGSSLPRALLAYYYSILHTIRDSGSSTFFPVVVDSPNQQAQDRTNLAKILTFIRDNQPAGSQLILGLEDDLGVKIPGTRVEMSDRLHSLREAEYESVKRELAPLLEAAFTLTP